jgi:hypothetical protein
LTKINLQIQAKEDRNTAHETVLLKRLHTIFGGVVIQCWQKVRIFASAKQKQRLKKLYDKLQIEYIIVKNYG